MYVLLLMYSTVLPRTVCRIFTTVVYPQSPVGLLELNKLTYLKILLTVTYLLTSLHYLLDT